MEDQQTFPPSIADDVSIRDLQVGSCDLMQKQVSLTSKSAKTPGLIFIHHAFLRSMGI
jgi:hypothetical protein